MIATVVSIDPTRLVVDDPPPLAAGAAVVVAGSPATVAAVELRRERDRRRPFRERMVAVVTLDPVDRWPTPIDVGDSVHLSIA